METLKSPYLKQNPTSLGQVAPNNGSSLSIEDYRHNLDYSNYLRQSGLEVLGTMAGNLVPNTALELIGGAGRLYELGKRGKNLIEQGDYSLNNILLGNIDKDDNDFTNIVTQFADKYKNPFGEIYQKNKDTFNTVGEGSGEWWANVIQSTIPTVAGFAAESFALGTGLAGGAVKLAEYLNTGVKGANAARKIAQGLTAFAVTKNESYMMSNQTYQKVYEDYLTRFGSQAGSEEDLKKIQAKAKQAAGNAASAVDGIYTALALPGNLTGLSSIFAHADDLADFFKKGVGSKMTLAEATKVGVDNPYIAKQLAKKNLTEGLGRESFFEGLEEVEGQFAQEAGEHLSDKPATSKNAIDQLGNFFKYTLNGEGALNFFLGSLMGGGQTAILENIPVHRVNTLNDDGSIKVNYNDKGEPIVEKQWVNSRTRDVFGKKIEFNSYKQAIQHDLDYLNNKQKEIADTNNPILKQKLQRELFDLQAFDSVKKGISDQLINSIKEITNISNEPIDTKELQDQLDSLQDQIVKGFGSEEEKESLLNRKTGLEANAGQEDLNGLGVDPTIQSELDSVNAELQKPVLTDEQKAQNTQLIQQSDALRKQLIDSKNLTPAVQSGIATSKEDNSYKQKGEDSIKQIKEVQSFYNKQKARFGENNDLAEHATHLYTTILSRENLALNWDKQLEKQKADIGLFDSIEDLADIENYSDLNSSKVQREEYDQLVKDYQNYANDPSKENEESLTKWIPNSSKDIWNTKQLHEALKDKIDKLQNTIKEKDSLIISNIRNSQSYQNYLKDKEDTDEEVEKYIQTLNKHSDSIVGYANTKAQLTNFKEKTTYLKERLADVTSPKGSELFIKRALQKAEYIKKEVEDEINNANLEQSEIENANQYYVRKIQSLNRQHSTVIDTEIIKIQDAVKELKISKKPSTIRSYFDTFLEKYANAVSNEELIKRYEDRIDELEEFKRQIQVNEQKEINDLLDKEKDSDKAKQITKKEEQIKEDKTVGVNIAPEEFSLFGEEEFNTPKVEIKEEVKEPVQEEERSIKVDNEHIKRLKSLDDYLGVKSIDFIKNNYEELKKLKKAKELLEYLKSKGIIQSYDTDFEEPTNIDVSEAKKLIKIVQDPKTTVSGEQTVQSKEETRKEEIKKDVEDLPIEIKKDIQEAKFTVEDFAEYISTIYKADKKAIEEKIIPFIAKLQKEGKIKNKPDVVQEAMDRFTTNFNISKGPQDQYQLAIKVSKLFLTLSGLDRYNKEINDFEEKLAALTKPIEKTVEIVEDIPEEVDIIQVEPQNIKVEKVKLENPTYIADNLGENKIRTTSTSKTNPLQLNLDTIQLHNPDFLNVGDTVELVRQQTNGEEEAKWRKGEPLTPENLVIRIMKDNEFVEFLPTSLYTTLPQARIVNELSKRNNLTDEEKETLRINSELLEKLKEETKEKQEALLTIRRKLFELPSGTSVVTTITSKSEGEHLQGEKRLLSESKLLDDTRIKFLLADNAAGTGDATDVKFRQVGGETVSIDDIANYYRYSKSLPLVSLWLKYPSNIAGKSNIIPATIGTIAKDYNVLEAVLTAYGKEDKAQLDYINDNFDYDITKIKNLEAFINQYFVYTYNNKNLANREQGITTYKDGNLKLKFNGKEVYFTKGKPNLDFFILLKEYVKKANKNVTLSSKDKGFKGINSQASFKVPTFVDGRIEAKEYSSYNEYISEYVSTDLTASTNSPTDKPNYIKNPEYSFDSNPVTSTIVENKVEEPKVEVKEKKKKKKYDEEEIDDEPEIKNKFKNYNIVPDSLNFSKKLLANLASGKYIDLKFSTGLVQNGAINFLINPTVVKNTNALNNLGNLLFKLNIDYFKGFPVFKKDNKEVFIDRSTLSIYERSFLSNEIDVNAVELYRQVMQTPNIPNKSVVLVQISNSSTREQLSEILKKLCNG